MSSNGWGSCFWCHPFGWSDTVVWAFPDGLGLCTPAGRLLTGGGAGGEQLLG